MGCPSPSISVGGVGDGGVTCKILSCIFLIHSFIHLFIPSVVCSDTVELNAKNGSFSSPNYPKNYPKYLDCSWKITVPPSYDLQLHFTSFNIQSCGEGCTCDFVEVRNELSIQGERFCGKSRPHPVTSRSAVTFVRFKSDGAVSGLGFRASYVAVKRSTIKPVLPVLPTVSCTAELTGNNGTFQSPNYDHSIYPCHVHCTWLIVVPRGYHVKLEFQTFDLEQCAACQCGFLEVRDGKFNRSSLLGRFCGSNTPSPVLSNDRYLFVRLVRMKQAQKGGFKARYQAVPTTGIATTNGKENTVSPIILSAPQSSSRHFIFHRKCECFE